MADPVRRVTIDNRELTGTLTRVTIGNRVSEQVTGRSRVSSSVRGLDGRSAYQSAVATGFTGTEAQWVESLGSGDAVAPSGPVFVWVDDSDGSVSVGTRTFPNGVLAHSYDLASDSITLTDTVTGTVVLVAPTAQVYDGTAQAVGGSTAVLNYLTVVTTPWDPPDFVATFTAALTP